MAKTGTFAFTDPEALEEAIDDYFDSRWQKRKIFPRDGDPYEEEYMRPPTMAGLALALGVTRVTLLHYGRGDGDRDPAFIPLIAQAKARIAEFAEEALYTREANVGARFALEVNHKYGRELEGQEETGEFTMNVLPPAQGQDLKAIPKWSEEDD